MAVQTFITEVSVRLVLNGGMDANGKAIMKNKLYKGIKTDALPEKVHEAAVALASLQGYQLDAVQMLSTNDVAQV